MSGRMFGRVISYIVLVLIGLVGIAPFVYLLILSFKSRIDVLTVPPDLHFDWATIKENYSQVINDQHYITFVENSVIVTGISTLIALGFGVPALQLPGVPIEPIFWGAVALVLVYSAYVSEVYRAGIESVHPSQSAAARSLGLTHGQALRFVVIPQAVRRVIPPLLNDFIGLQKDTALVALLGVVEAFRQSQIEVAATFNYTPYICTAILFIAITVPLARFTDWLIARDRRRQQAGKLA